MKQRDIFPKVGDIPSTDGSNLSVVVQGGCTDMTVSCLRSLRTVFPRAEIILSTWRGSSVEGLEADRVVFSDDPGAVWADRAAGVLNNVNRQLVSTKAGLAAASRAYILKTRTDILFYGPDFLSYFGKYDEIPSPYFQNRLLICNYYTRNPRVSRLCFHPSDWIVFGRARDVRRYYESVPLMTAEDGAWFTNHAKRSDVFPDYLCRYVPEQHIFLHFLRRERAVRCQCYYDCTRASIEETERLFADCFVVLDYQRQLDISFLKYRPNRFWEAWALVSHRQWKAMYGHVYRRGASYGWLRYRAESRFAALFWMLRRCCVRVLAFCGVKERVKRMLSAGCFTKNA